MKSRKINYVIVGGFVIAMLAALTFSMAMLSGHSGDTEDYYVVYDNVSGVGFGTKVLLPSPSAQGIIPRPLRSGNRSMQEFPPASSMWFPRWLPMPAT
jgi:hypothetical protein